MKLFRILALLALAAFSLFGCLWNEKPAPAVPTVKVRQTTPLTDAGTKADDAAKAVETKYDVRDSKLMANTQSGRG